MRKIIHFSIPTYEDKPSFSFRNKKLAVFDEIKKGKVILSLSLGERKKANDAYAKKIKKLIKRSGAPEKIRGLGIQLNKAGFSRSYLESNWRQPNSLPPFPRQRVRGQWPH